MADQGKKNETSLLKAAIIGAPIAAGATFSVRDYLKNSKTLQQSSIEQAVGVAKKANYSKPQPLTMTEHLDFLQRHSRYISEEGAEVARVAWMQAIEHANPLAKRDFESIKTMISTLKPENVYSAIENTIRTNQSSLAKGIYKRFEEKLRTLQGHQDITGKIPTFSTIKSNQPVQGSFKPYGMEIQSAISRIESSLKAIPGSTTHLWTSKPGWEESGLGNYLFRFTTPYGEINMNLPIASQGVMAVGPGQQSKYIAPDVWIWNKSQQEFTEKMSRHEYFLSEFEKQIVPKIQTGELQGRDISKAARKLQGKLISDLQNITNAPIDLKTQALKTYEATRGSQVEVLVKDLDKVRRATEDERMSILSREKNLFGGTSPSAIAKGRFNRLDLSQKFVVPELADWGRRVEQGYREYELSDEARRFFFQSPKMERYRRYLRYETDFTKQLTETTISPSVKTLYLDPDIYAKELAKMNLGEGEHLGTKALRDTFEFQALKTKRLSSVTRPDLVGDLTNLTFAKKEILGETTAGTYFRHNKHMKLLRGIQQTTRNGGNELLLYYMDTRRMENHAKIFDSLKGLLRFRDDKSFMKTAYALTRGNLYSSSEIDIITTTDELKKDLGKHAQQITSGMAEVFEKYSPERNFRTLLGKSAKEAGALGMHDFRIAPQEVINTWRESITKAQPDISPSDFHKQFLQKSMRFATEEGKVTPGEFAQIFGATPSVLGKETTEELIHTATGAKASQLLKAMEKYKGFAVGTGRMTYAGPSASAGVTGSIEPRAFDILKSGPLGEFGTQLADDLMQRLAVTEPHKLATHEELTKTLLSTIGKEQPGAGAKIWDVTKQGYNQEAFQTWLEGGGGYIRPGKGMHELYVPGAEAMRGMMPYETQDKIVKGLLPDIYHGMAAKASQLYSATEPISTQEYQKALEKSINELTTHWAPGGKGMGGFLRGKILGSTYLKGVSRAGGFSSDDPFLAGITDKYFNKMHHDMMKSNLYSKLDLETIKNKFMAGEDIGGVVARHPFIGQFSVQPMRFQRVAGVNRPEIVLPEIIKDVKLQGVNEPKRIKLGPLVGLAGDKDADEYVSMLLAPDLEKQARQMTTNLDSDYVQRYMQHQVRYQLLKAKTATAGELSVRESMVGGTVKLGAAETWVPKLSVELDVAKRAAAQYGGTKGADAAMLAEFLEQNLLKTKHLNPAEVRRGGIEAMMQETLSALQVRGQKGEDRLNRVVQQLIKSDETAQKLLTGTLTIESGLEGTGIRNQIEGLDVRQAIKTTMSSLDEFQSSGEARIVKQAVGRERIGLRDLPELLERFSVTAMKTQSGVFASVSRAVTTATNMMGQVGKGLIKYHKPIGLGFGGALALSAILSSPKETIGPGSALTNVQINMNAGKAGNRFRPEDMLSDQQSLGHPTTPNILGQQRALLSESSMNTTIRARIPTGRNAGRIAGELSRVAPNSNVNVNIRDYRSSANRHIIANKIS